MATLWKVTNGEWTPRALPHDRILDAAEFGQAGCELVPLYGEPGHVLFRRPHVAARVNGEAVGTVVVLQHRDELQIDGQCCCYSSESRPQITEFRAEPGRRTPKCALCSTYLADADAIVVCPGCGRRYHQMDATADREAKHCFTYEPHCRCGHPTDLSGANLWQPESDNAMEVCHAS